MTVLSLLIFTAVKYSTTDITRTKNYTETLQATYIAEAGIHRALGYFNYDASGTARGKRTMALMTNWTIATGHLARLPILVWVAGGGTYSVVIKDNADGDADTSADVDKNVVLTSTGTINGVTATVEAYIYRPQFKSKFALLSEGDIDINGNSTTIAGSNGAVHSNGDVTQTGGPTVEEGASATGSCGGSDCSSGASEEFVPVIEPSDYEQYADYIFNDDGTIDQNVSGTITTGVEGNAISPKFSHNAQGWSVGNSATIGTDVPNQAFFYFKDDFKAASIGSAGTPWEITLVVEKSIAWTGSADITNWNADSDHTPDIQNLFLVAGNDIKISGLNQDTQGLIACKDQFNIQGGANIEGYFIGNNLTTDDNVVNGTESAAKGGITITYNGDLLAPVLSDKVTVLSWQKT